MSALYDRDFHAWTQEQARALREAAARGNNAPVDWEHLAEEVNDLGNQVRYAIRSHLATIIEPLLKLEQSPDTCPRRKWRLSADKARRTLADRLEENPSLCGWPEEVLDKAWRDGLSDARHDDSLDPGVLPGACPYSLDRIMDMSWWPENRHGHAP